MNIKFISSLFKMDVFMDFLKKLVMSNSGYSSKRLSALILIMSGIIIPVICIFLKPIGVIDDSVLILSCQLLAAGCGLMGFTLKENYYNRPGNPNPDPNHSSKNDSSNKMNEDDKSPSIKNY